MPMWPPWCHVKTCSNIKLWYLLSWLVLLLVTKYDSGEAPAEKGVYFWAGKEIHQSFMGWEREKVIWENCNWYIAKLNSVLHFYWVKIILLARNNWKNSFEKFSNSMLFVCFYDMYVHVDSCMMQLIFGFS